MWSHVRNSGPLPFLENEGIFVKEMPIDIWIRRWKKETHVTNENKQEMEDRAEKKSNGTKFNKISKYKKSATDSSLQNIKHDPGWSSGLSTWQRLFLHHTQSSVRHSAIYICPSAPQDQLDIVLDATYEHQGELFPDTTDVYLQKETQGMNTWRRLRNYRLIPPKRIVSRGHPITYGGTKSCSNIYSVKLGIPAPHVAQTNAGYSRREDGALYKNLPVFNALARLGSSRCEASGFKTGQVPEDKFFSIEEKPLEEQ